MVIKICEFEKKAVILQNYKVEIIIRAYRYVKNLSNYREACNGGKPCVSR